MPAAAPDREQGFPAEVADGHDVSAQVRVCGAAPVVEGGKRLARPARICGRLVPTHAGHRIVVRSGDVRAHFPCRGPRAARCVAEVRHRGRERQFPAILQKWLAPQFRAAVSAIVDESFERAIRDLMAINPVVRQTNVGNVFKAGNAQPGHLIGGCVIRTIPGGAWLAATSVK